MHFNLLIFALFFRWITAFTVQEDAADGFYIAYYDANGNEIHVKDPDTDPEWIEGLDVSNPFPSVQQDQPISLLESIWCGCGISMDHGNCDAAVADLKNQLGGYAVIPGGMSWYSIRGGVVAFVCNRSPAGSQGVAYADRLTNSLSAITQACGWYIAGTQEIYERQGSDLDYGYMNWRDGLDFCHDAEGSPSHSC